MWQCDSVFLNDTHEHNFILFFFFFQAEDGIRDGTVTGVQTCALPISSYGAGCRKQSGKRGGGDVHGAAQWSERYVCGRSEHGGDECQRSSDIDDVHGEWDGGWSVQRGGECARCDLSEFLADEHGGACGEGGGDERFGAECGDQHDIRGAFSGDGDGCREPPGERGGGDVHGAAQRSERYVYRDEHGGEQREWGGDVDDVHGEWDGGWSVQRGGERAWCDLSELLVDQQIGRASCREGV